ncbi:hypothetical protein MA16_Dca001557 [Dendrobium catenatum]|uniref:Uncharacterized protein n=1 Tax=Dendrobium catenatum TaxID=906689 RepID=A0A2I0WMS6_9ASPA|nr:hypothetical protein MA16_Dca001557 [Dendrobium catenatum]
MYPHGKILEPRPLNSGNFYVKMPVMPKKNFTSVFLCTLNVPFIGIIGLGINV